AAAVPATHRTSADPSQIRTLCMVVELPPEALVSRPRARECTIGTSGRPTTAVPDARHSASRRDEPHRQPLGRSSSLRAPLLAGAAAKTRVKPFRRRRNYRVIGADASPPPTKRADLPLQPHGTYPATPPRLNHRQRANIVD